MLPDRYSPLQRNGNGIQSVSLTEVSQEFVEVLAGLIGAEARSLMDASNRSVVVEDGKILTGDDLDVWERRLGKG